MALPSLSIPFSGAEPITLSILDVRLIVVAPYKGKPIATGYVAEGVENG
jgi:hypothetical protein